MPYIGKPQSSDPITVNASNIEDGSIIAADISSSLGVAISGSFTTVSSSLGSRITLVEGGTTSKTLVSGSAQLADDISGSLGDNADVIRSLDRTTISGSITTVSSSLASRVTVNEGRVNQGVKTTDSPTFAGGTVTGDFAVGGTLTAQEVHTEFESASILFTSGSTQFGNSSDDVHDFKGNKISGSVTSTGSFGSAHFMGTGGVGIGTNNPGRLLDLVTPSDAVALNLRMRSADDFSFIIFTDHDVSEDYIGQLAVKRTGANTGEMQFYTSGDTLRMLIDDSGKVGIGAASPAAHLEVVGGTDYSQIQLTDTDTDNTVQRTGILSQHYDSDEQAVRTIGMYNSDTTSNVQIGGGSGDHNSATLIQFFTSANTTTTAGTLRMIVSSSGHVGIGTDNPGSPLDVRGTSSEPIVNFGDAASRDSEGTNLVGSGAFRYQFQNGASNRPSVIEGGGDIAANEAAVYFTGFASGQDTNHKNLGGILIFRKNTGNSNQNGSQLQFRTKADNTTSSTTRMVIDSSGDVGIGTTNPATKFVVSSSNATTADGVALIHQAAATNRPTLVVKQDIQGGNNHDDQGLVIRVKGTSTGLGNSLRVYNRDDSATAFVVQGGGNVGIGTDNPGYQLDIQNTDHAVMRILAGTDKSASLRLKNNAQDWDVNCQTVDHFAVYDQTGGAAAFLLTATNYYVSLPGVYSGTTSSAANVHINSGGSLLRVTSAKKYKEDIKDYKVGLDAVNQMNPVSYKSKKDMHNSADEKIDEKTYVGLLADDIHDLGLSEFVEYGEDGEVEGLFYERMVSICINAIKELSAKIDDLENS